MSEIMWVYASIGPEAAFEALDAIDQREGAAYLNAYSLSGKEAADDYLWTRIWNLYEREQAQKTSNRQ